MHDSSWVNDIHQRMFFNPVESMIQTMRDRRKATINMIQLMMPSQYLESFTHRFAKWTGSASGFVVALLSIIMWFSLGEVCSFSHSWQNGFSVYINTITFLMVFLIQRGQNKELSILHIKLNELISATKYADNHLINVEDLTEKEISAVQDIHRAIGTKE
jgi:low affinity Fe/Cu permease